MSTPSDSKSWSPRTQKIILWSFGAVVLLGLLYWNYTSFASGLWEADPSSPDCIKIKGVVKEIHSNPSTRKTQETFYMTYTYQVGAESFENKEKITMNVFNRYKVNDPVDICHMKNHPSRSAILNNDVKGEDFIYVFLADIVFLVFVGMIIRHTIRERKKAAGR
jgi:hypothetical protein